MIYTCYEMIADCRAGRPEGWRFFVSSYVPVIRQLLARYRPAEPAGLEPILAALHRPESALFQSLDPAPERWFVAQLRQKLLEQLTPTSPASTIDLETISAALEPMTLVEKQVAWLETMLYSPAETGVLLRMAPATAERIRGKAAESSSAARSTPGAAIFWRKTGAPSESPRPPPAAPSACRRKRSSI